MERGIDQDSISPFQNAKAGLILGGERYVESIRQLVLQKKGSASPDVLGFNDLIRSEPRPCMDSIRIAVESVFADLSECQRRRMLVFALDRVTFLKRIEITPDTLADLRVP